MDIRGRRLRQQDERTTRFISSIGFDGAIADEVLRVNRAHMVELVRRGEVSRPVGSKCLTFLRDAHVDAAGAAPAEDFHHLLEQAAVDALGVDVAGYLNLGKSRNDQVAAAILMHLKRSVLRVIEGALELQEAVVWTAEAHGRTVIPGYTHLQHAQPITLAHHMFAHFDSLGRDIERLSQLYARADSSPMGAAAIAGTSVRVDRGEVAALLGFSRTTANAMDAVSSRDVELEALASFAILMCSLSRLAEELVIWSSREFSFVEIPDEFTATSSIMPQKKNPVVAEIARAKAGSAIGSLCAGLAIVKGLPHSYNLDLQEVTPHLWRSASDAEDALALLAAMVRGLRFDGAAIARAIEGDFSTATALANYLVREHGISFRQAHAVVGALVRDAIVKGKPLEHVADARLGGLLAEETGRRINVDTRAVRSTLDAGASLGTITSSGGSNPDFIAGGLKSRADSMREERAHLKALRSAADRSDRNLARSVESIIQGVNR